MAGATGSCVLTLNVSLFCNFTKFVGLGGLRRPRLNCSACCDEGRSLSSLPTNELGHTQKLHHEAHGRCARGPAATAGQEESRG